MKKQNCCSVGSLVCQSVWLDICLSVRLSVCHNQFSQQIFWTIQLFGTNIHFCDPNYYN